MRCKFCGNIIPDYPHTLDCPRHPKRLAYEREYGDVLVNKKANPFLEPHKFGLTTHQVDVLAPIMDEMDRNARAYGWEIGHGQPLVRELEFSPENPFINPNWRDGVVDDQG